MIHSERVLKGSEAVCDRRGSQTLSERTFKTHSQNEATAVSRSV
jgi:hypothetical protein